MTGKISGIDCPTCGSLLTHNLQELIIGAEGYPVGLTISCMACEYVWTEELEQDEETP